MKIEETFIVKNEKGIHARPSASFVKLANQFKSDIEVEYDSSKVNGKSIFSMMALAVNSGSLFKVIANGEDANIAISQLGNLVNSGFGE
jgi:phosphocarrier protein